MQRDNCASSTHTVCATQSHFYAVKHWNEIAEKESKIGVVGKRTLILLDLDNTLLKESTYVGSPYWFDWQKVQIEKHSEYALAKNMDEFYPLNEFVLRLSPMHLTENTTPGILRAWQKKGCDIVVVTARSPHVRYATRRALDENGFRIGPIPGASHFHNSGQISYINGILYLSGHNKAEGVRQWIVESGVNPKRWSHWVFVDDTKSNLEELKKHAWSDLGVDRLDLFYYQNLKKSDYPLSENLSELKQLDDTILDLYQHLSPVKSS